MFGVSNGEILTFYVILGSISTPVLLEDVISCLLVKWEEELEEN